MAAAMAPDAKGRAEDRLGGWCSIRPRRLAAAKASSSADAAGDAVVEATPTSNEGWDDWDLVDSPLSASRIASEKLLRATPSSRSASDAGGRITPGETPMSDSFMNVDALTLCSSCDSRMFEDDDPSATWKTTPEMLPMLQGSLEDHAGDAAASATPAVLTLSLHQASSMALAAAAVTAVEQAAVSSARSRSRPPSRDAALRVFLRTARPDWQRPDLHVVQKKLARVEIDSVPALIRALRSDLLNARLKSAGEKCFKPETLRALHEHAEGVERLIAAWSPERWASESIKE
mmetsp:Transcript_65752/g.140662  ORF Transcript_65752/g.140662 Transcript_65752/m.140662 type:complete len:290 (-) Transcript_65752:106-975(-)